MKKKWIVMLMAAMMVTATVFTGCGDGSSSSSKSDTTQADDKEDTKADADTDATAAEGDETKGDSTALGDYKNKDFSEWDGDDIGQYFIDNGTFSHADWYYVQKDEYVEGTGWEHCVSYMEEDTGAAMVIIIYFNPASTLPETEEQLKCIRENKETTEDCGSLPIDHLVGNFAFCYTLCADDDEYDKFDAAYEAMVEEFKLTPEF